MQEDLLKQAFLSGFMQQCEQRYRSLEKEAGIWDIAKGYGRAMNPWYAAKDTWNYLAGIPGRIAGSALQSPKVQNIASKFLKKEVGRLKSQFTPYMIGMAAAPFVSQLMLGPGGMFGPKAGMSQAQAGQMVGNIGRMQRSPMANKLFDYQKLNF
jgi:hypothetical protein